MPRRKMGSVEGRSVHPSPQVWLSSLWLFYPCNYVGAIHLSGITGKSLVQIATLLVKEEDFSFVVLPPPMSALASRRCAFYASSVFAARCQISTENELYVIALNALTRRAHSVHEMKQKLGQRTEDEKLIRAVMVKLKEHRYLDDARYALEFARTRVQVRKQGRFRIARELRTRGVPDLPIEVALDAVFAETDEASLVRAKLQRMAEAKGSLDARKVASLYRSLLRAGFGGDVIRAEIRKIGAGDIESDAEPGGNSDPG